MTINQVLKKCKIARDCGEAYLPGGDLIRYDDFTKQYSLLSSWRHQTICVTYKPEYIATLCAD